VKINISHVAKLANIKIDDKELKHLEPQISEILKYIEKLNELNTKSVEETSQVTKLENITRADKSGQSLSQEEALSNSKKTEKGSFVVDSIFE
jgi:aspartyl-tRNA(Asn)/glutamyl-tRNA(Gln) amidotransferase subunit C